MVHIYTFAVAVSALFSYVAADKNDKKDPDQKEPPSLPSSSEQSGNRVLALALSADSNPHKFETDFNLSKGSMENCLDSIYHGDNKVQLDVGNDFVVINNAPSVCVNLVRKADTCEKNNCVAELVGEDSIRLNGASQVEVDFLKSIDTSFFDIRVL